MRTLFAVSALILLGASTDPVLDINVTVTPTAYSSFQLLARPTPDTYTCNVSVTDPPRGGVSAQVIATPGVPAQVTRKNGDYEVEFRVDIAKSGDIAETKVTAKHAGAVVARQRSTVRLMKSNDKPYKPAQ
jgi:hypothetical protein